MEVIGSKLRRPGGELLKLFLGEGGGGRTDSVEPAILTASGAEI
jgi:hypothetical protein